jgi:enoyl-CoA hydratase/carnithine racemase
MLLTAEKLHAQEALKIGLIDAIADDPIVAALEALPTPLDLPTLKDLSS